MAYSRKKLEQELRQIMAKGEFLPLENFISSVPAKKLISPLIRIFYKADSLERWLAIKAFGKVVGSLAQEDMEQARIVIRRLMWSLNDESGGIGWGAPEAMAEAMVNHPGLCQEYSRILLSYVWEEGNYLEYLPLRRGALWGLYRLALKCPEEFNKIKAHEIVKDYLEDPDPESRALAILALSSSNNREFCSEIKKLNKDTAKVKLFLDSSIKELTVAEISRDALRRLNC